MRPGWTGPFLIVGDTLPRAIQIQENPQAKIKTVHPDHLKPLRSDPPREAWQTNTRRRTKPLPEQNTEETASQNSDERGEMRVKNKRPTQARNTDDEIIEKGKQPIRRSKRVRRPPNRLVSMCKITKKTEEPVHMDTSCPESGDSSTETYFTAEESRGGSPIYFEDFYDSQTKVQTLGPAKNDKNEELVRPEDLVRPEEWTNNSLSDREKHNPVSVCHQILVREDVLSGTLLEKHQENLRGRLILKQRRAHTLCRYRKTWLLQQLKEKVREKTRRDGH